jgi:hypothetical protein
MQRLIEQASIETGAISRVPALSDCALLLLGLVLTRP